MRTTVKHEVHIREGLAMTDEVALADIQLLPPMGDTADSVSLEVLEDLKLLVAKTVAAVFVEIKDKGIIARNMDALREAFVSDEDVRMAVARCWESIFGSGGLSEGKALPNSSSGFSVQDATVQIMPPLIKKKWP